MSLHKQRGFSAVELVIAVLVVGAIGATGYLAYNRMKNNNKTQTTSDQTNDSATSGAPAVNSTKDLDTAAKTLDETDVDATTSDSTALDSEVNNF